MKYYYKYENDNKWVQVNGEGDDPKNCKISWDCSENNDDLQLIMEQKNTRSPLYGWVEFNDTKIINNIYVQVLRVSSIIKDGYICVSYSVPKIDPLLPNPEINMIEEETKVEDKTEKISINKSELSHQGLVQRDVTVKRGGKTFTQKRWVKPGEDEPAPKKGKKVEVEDDKAKKNSLDIFTVGDEISMIGEFLIIEKIDINEKTIKMSDGKVYTLKAAKLYSKPLPETKYKVDDKVNFNGKEQTITKVNRGLGIVEFNDGTMHSFDDMETFSKDQKKESKIKDLKPVKKESEVKKETKIKIKSDKKDTEIITGSAKDGSLSAKDRKMADKQLQEFVKNLQTKENKIGIHLFDSTAGAAKAYTAGISFSMNSYLLSDRKKMIDYETVGNLKPVNKEEKEWVEKKCRLLDEFLNKAPKVQAISYRGMHWDMDNPEEKKLHNKFMSEISEGNIIESKAYTSTTGDGKILRSYGSANKLSEVTARIEYKTKSGVYMASESGNPEQQEILLPHGMKFKIIEVGKIRDGNINIKMEEVD